MLELQIRSRQIQHSPNMITVDKLTVQLGTKLFNENTKKLLKIQAQNTIIKTKNPAIPTSQTNLQWEQSIQIPLIYGQQLPFEIFQKHEFGYNPQEIKSVMHGVIVFHQGDHKFNNFEIFDINQKKIGYLSVNIKNKPNIALSVQKSPLPNSSVVKKKIIDQTQLVIISSIIVNIPLIRTKRAYASIIIGDNEVRTSPAKSKSGELVFIEKYELDKNPSTKQGRIQIISCASEEPDHKIAQANFYLERKIDRKLKFLDDQNQQVGEGFIDGKVQLKSQAFSSKIFASIIRQGFRKQFSPSQKTARTYNDLSRSLFNNSSFIRSNGTQMSRSGNKMSIINQNTNIKFPQQKRFYIPRDAPNNKCSYLQESERTFEFKQKNVDKYYRGASIGYGGKADFTGANKQVPSVGKYRLPSIWDRY